MLDLSGQLLIPNILCTLSLMFAGSCHDSPACHADDECRLSSVISLAQVEEGPSRMSGRPRRGVTKLIEHNYGLGSCEIQQSCDQCHDALACHEAHGCRLNSVITSAQDNNKQPKCRGRHPILVTPELLERRRLSRKRINSSRPKGGP
ncbi:uncharacterized protein LOC141684402 isoform X14 [Apium graveolens]|uniref:uncharacterized protein LOC141684402 isoform X14 n=1 Tax=Apium graveolens TaxID=4045 RepID=UPI003D78C2A7